MNETTGFKMNGLRWLIIGLVFFITVINYIDRQTISVLAPVITKELGLSNTEFGAISVWFLIAYTLSQGVSGKIFDRFGTKLGFVFFGCCLVGCRDASRICDGFGQFERVSVFARSRRSGKFSGRGEGFGGMVSAKRPCAGAGDF